VLREKYIKEDVLQLVIQLVNILERKLCALCGATLDAIVKMDMRGMETIFVFL